MALEPAGSRRLSADQTSPVAGRVPNWFSYLLLLGTVLVLGFNWPLLAIGLRDISPLWLASLRVSSAAVIIFCLAIFTGRLVLPTRGDASVIVSVALGRLIIVMILVFIALTLVPPGRSSVLVWTASLWTVPLAVRFLGEPMTARRWLGLGIGIVGILFLVEPWGTDIDTSTAVGYGLLLLAAMAQAVTTVHVRGHAWVATPLALLPWQLLLAALPMTAATVFLEGIPEVEWTPELVAIIAYQGALATGFAMWAQMTVLQILPAVPTNLTLMMVPVVGLLSSIVVVDESVSLAAIFGAALIGLGVLTGVNFRTKPAVTPPPVD